MVICMTIITSDDSVVFSMFLYDRARRIATMLLALLTRRFSHHAFIHYIPLHASLLLAFSYIFEVVSALVLVVGVGNVTRHSQRQFNFVILQTNIFP